MKPSKMLTLATAMGLAIAGGSPAMAEIKFSSDTMDTDFLRQLSVTPSGCIIASA